MSLQNLHEVFEQTQLACAGVSLASIPLLPQKFKDDYAKLITEDASFSRNDKIFWGRDGSAELWSRGKRTRIYVPSVGFFIAWRLVPLYRELILYRATLSSVLEVHGESLNDTEEQGCVPYIESSSALSPVEKDYLKKFVTDGSWWGKGRQINRAQDFFESPLMQCARLTQETQSEIARIAKQLSENAVLLDTLSSVARVSLNSPSDAPRQLITYGAPGTGKSWSVKVATAGASTIRTTFHPDSDYSTFVGAYKPSMKTVPRTMMAGETIKRVTNGDAALLTEEKIAYTFVPQAFVKAYVQAWKFKAEANGGAATRQYLVIEEINRGNCAQIFGDLFQLLDRNDAGFSEYEVAADDDLRRHLAGQFADLARVNAQTPLALGIEADLARRVLSGEALLLPDNLYIWATMNTSDQSLFPIDSAFKRRWEWKYMPIYDADRGYRIVVGEASYKWWDFLEKANALVQEFTDREDKKLGYFFCKAGADGAIPLETFVGKVVFYLWNDVFKDVGFDHEAFAAEDGGRLLFKAFFNPDGSPNAASVKQLMENLGVAEA